MYTQWNIVKESFKFTSKLLHHWKVFTVSLEKFIKTVLSVFTSRMICYTALTNYWKYFFSLARRRVFLGHSLLRLILETRCTWFRGNFWRLQSFNKLMICHTTPTWIMTETSGLYGCGCIFFLWKSTMSLSFEVYKTKMMSSVFHCMGFLGWSLQYL